MHVCGKSFKTGYFPGNFQVPHAVYSAEFHCRHTGYKSRTYHLKFKVINIKIVYSKQRKFIMLWAAIIWPMILSIFLGSSAKLQLTLDTAEDVEKPLESHLDNPNYFEGDLDISQAIITAYYEQQSERDVRTVLSLFFFFFFYCATLAYTFFLSTLLCS